MDETGKEKLSPDERRRALIGTPDQQRDRFLDRYDELRRNTLPQKVAAAEKERRDRKLQDKIFVLAGIGLYIREGQKMIGVPTDSFFETTPEGRREIRAALGVDEKSYQQLASGGSIDEKDDSRIQCMGGWEGTKDRGGPSLWALSTSKAEHPNTTYEIVRNYDGTIANEVVRISENPRFRKRG